MLFEGKKTGSEVHFENSEQNENTNVDNWTNQRLKRYIRTEVESGMEDKILRYFTLSNIDLGRLNNVFCSYFGTALSSEKDMHIINFLIKNIDPQNLVRTLKNDDYHYLKVFAVGAATLEEVSRYTEPEKQVRVEKFKLLLQFNAGLIDEFIEKHKSERYMEKALLEYNQAKSELNVELITDAMQEVFI